MKHIVPAFSEKVYDQSVNNSDTGLKEPLFFGREVW